MNHINRDKSALQSGFTLIELSIVLVVIGLIIGGILTGRDLMDVAAQRAQVTQMQKYSTAVNTFRNKYGYLPGDIPDPQASGFGFQARSTNRGEGDGNGVLESYGDSSDSQAYGYATGSGELAVFWQDISTAGLIDTSVIYNVSSNVPKIALNPSPNVTLTSSPGIKDWLPTSKIGSNIFIYVFSLNGLNYFALSTVDTIGGTVQSSENPGLTVQQAYNIDKKIDDGLPQSGSVTACYVNFNVVNYRAIWAAGGNIQGAGTGGSGCAATTAATPYATTNCYDNTNVAGTETYSLSQNANVQNCALSFRFQ